MADSNKPAAPGVAPAVGAVLYVRAQDLADPFPGSLGAVTSWKVEGAWNVPLFAAPPAQPVAPMAGQVVTLADLGEMLRKVWEDRRKNYYHSTQFEKGEYDGQLSAIQDLTKLATKKAEVAP